MVQSMLCSRIPPERLAIEKRSDRDEAPSSWRCVVNGVTTKACKTWIPITSPPLTTVYVCVFSIFYVYQYCVFLCPFLFTIFFPLMILFDNHHHHHHHRCQHQHPAESSYRGTTDEDLERERNSEGKIKIALAQAKRAMKFGDSYGAVSALEAVKQVLLCMK